MYGTEQLKVSCVFLQNATISSILLVILLFSGITNGALMHSTSLTLQEINLVRCLKHVSHRYFPPGRSLVISSPSTYRDVQQELIVDFHRIPIWPVLLVLMVILANQIKQTT